MSYCSELACYQYSIPENSKCTVHAGQLLSGSGGIELCSPSLLYPVYHIKNKNENKNKI